MKVSQMSLVTAILAELDRQKKGASVLDRQLNAIVRAADDIVREMARDGKIANPGDGLSAWLESDDRGSSSNAIVDQLTKGRCKGNYPLDPGDFGRCHRLMQVVPEFRPRIGEMAAVSLVWARLATHWGELEALYEKELPSGYAARLLDRMRELIDGKTPAPSSPKQSPCVPGRDHDWSTTEKGVTWCGRCGAEKTPAPPSQ